MACNGQRTAPAATSWPRREVGREAPIIHGLANNPDRFGRHERILYRIIAVGLLAAKNGALPRTCMLNPGTRKPVGRKTDIRCWIGRIFLRYFHPPNPSHGPDLCPQPSVSDRLNASPRIHTVKGAICVALLAGHKKTAGTGGKPSGIWWRVGGSNSRPPECHSGALPN